MKLLPCLGVFLLREGLLPLLFILEFLVVPGPMFAILLLFSFPLKLEMLVPLKPLDGAFT